MHQNFASTPPSVRIMSWLGFRSSDRSDRPEAIARPAAGPAIALREEERHRLLGMISSFVIDHGLEVSGSNLTAVHGALSGADHNLAKQIDARLKAQKAITQDWFDEVTGGDSYAAYRQELDTLLTKLETGITSFTKTTQETQSATGDYRAALEHHVQALKNPEEGVLIGLADLAKAMLDRTRQIESDVRRNENEAKSLRKSLAKARRDADIDHLTGLPNRRAFETLLDTHYEEARAAGEPLTVAFCDIDHFKKVNDTHGHDTGDRVIKAIGEALSAISGQNCHVARHGGEEFVMLFRGKTTDQALIALDNAREAMSKRRFVNRENEQAIGTVTFSGGLADVFAFANSRTALKAADGALYKAKEAGRNRICVAEQDPGLSIS
ncbi:MAG: GGDEF domain-containing protein [Novosphingobium sp.]